jgi:hypothetical protein
MLGAAPDVHAMRDPTRGGLSSALNEIAAASRVGIELTESAFPMKAEVRAACEMRRTRSAWSRRCARTTWGGTRRSWAGWSTRIPASSP